MPNAECPWCKKFFRAERDQRFCCKSHARHWENSMTIKKTIVLTDFGAVDAVGERQYTDAELRRMHAQWIKVFVQERHERPLMLALDEIVHKRDKP